MKWELLHPRANMAMLGLVPDFLSEDDPASAKEQIDKNYRHGGGWHTFNGFKRLGAIELQYHGDPPLVALAQTMLRKERIVFYQHSWVAIFQPDGTFEVARVD